MIGTFIVPAKKHLDIPGKVLTIVLVLTISIFQSTSAAAANALILDDDEAGTLSNGRHGHWKKSDPHGSRSLHTSRSGTNYSRTGGSKRHTGESKHHNGESKHRNGGPKRHASESKHRTGGSKHRTKVSKRHASEPKHSTGGPKHRASVSHDITHLDGTSTVTVNQPDSTSLVNKTATTTTRSLDNSATSAAAIMPVPAGDNSTVNTAPTSSGSPATSVDANSAYSFEPLASDPDDGDSLNFSSTVNGTETQTGTVTLNWTAPVARTDGSPITMSEIAGFTVHYGTSTGSHPNRLNVDDGSATSATIADLQLGTYYLVVTTRDDAGRESGDSSEVAKVVN